MWEVIRIDPYGYKGYKHFNTESEALTWLESRHVKEDIEDGYNFQLHYKEEK